MKVTYGCGHPVKARNGKDAYLQVKIEDEVIEEADETVGEAFARVVRVAHTQLTKATVAFNQHESLRHVAAGATEIGEINE